MTMEIGTVTRAITARSGLIQNIIASTPMRVSIGRDDLAERLLQRLLDVVDVVRHPAEDVAARMAVEIPERQTGELQIDISAQGDRSSGPPPRP